MLTAKLYGAVDNDSVIHSSRELAVDDDEMGPELELGNPFGHRYVQLNAPIDWSAKPSPTHVLRWKGFEQPPEWEETFTLEQIKAAKNAEIDLAREHANRTYFDFGGLRIACGDVDWKDIMSASAEISLTHQMPDDWVGFWKGKTPEGVTQYVPIPDVATWTLFIQAMVARGQTHFRKSQGLKVALVAAETPAAVALIKW